MARAVVKGSAAKLTALAVFACASDSAAQSAPTAGDVTEVQVHGSKTPRDGRTSMSAREIRDLPGAFGDPFRVIETLPGVVPVVSGLPFFFVRGAPPGSNGYFLDGIRVPFLFHVGLGPSVIHPGLVQKVDFYPGGYPARFGRVTGGVLSGETKAPADTVHGEGNLRLFDVGALVEAPFAQGRGTALVAGRYSYTAPIVSIAAPEARLDYWDYQSRTTFKTSDRDTLSLFVFGSHDFLGERKNDGRETTLLASEFHRFDARWDRRLPGGGKLRIAATFGIDRSATEDVKNIRDHMVSVRAQLEQPLSRSVTIRAGTDTTFDRYDLAPTGEQTASLYPSRNELVTGAYVETMIAATSRWTVSPSIRADLFEAARPLAKATSYEKTKQTNGAIPAVDPRLTSRLQLGERVAWVSTFGITHQPPSFVIPVPGLQLGRLGQGLQTGIQTSHGLETTLPAGFTFAPTVFHHHYLGLTDFTTTCGEISDDGESECVDRRVRGRTFGLELLLRRSITERLSGLVSYTLSRTTRSTQVFLLGRRGRWAEILGDFDRTHVMNVVLAYDLGRGWRAGARGYFYTGRPYSSRAFDLPLPPYNDRRYPNFFRIDGRVEKAWQLGPTTRLAFVVEWLNMTLAKEATSLNCVAADRRGRSVAEDIRLAVAGDLPPQFRDQCAFETIGPVTIPSIGLEGQF